MKVEVAVLGSRPTSVDVKQHFNSIRCQVRAQELCESRGGRPGLVSLLVPMASVDVKQHLRKKKINAQDRVKEGVDQNPRP